MLAVWTAATATGLALMPTAAQAAVPGSLYGWGLAKDGQICNGGGADVTAPVLTTATGVTAIAAGAFHSLYVSGGAVFACGVNRFGQLGDNTVVNKAAPVAVAAPANASIASVSAGWDHSLALSTTGVVYAWGSNFSGQLGDTTLVDRHTPVPVAFPPGTPAMTSIAAGGNFSLSLDNTGKVWSWGNNLEGELGRTTTDMCTAKSFNNPCSVTPTVVSLTATVTAIAAGTCHVLALTSTGAVLAWGLNNYGQLGNNARGVNSAVPVAAAAPANAGVTAIAAGGMHSLALSAGAVLAWGRNNKGQLGDATTTDSPVPVAAAAPANAGVTTIAAGWQHSLALTTTGAVLAWGWNASGQLGNGSTTDSPTPLAASAPADAGVSLISAGYAHSVAVK